MSTLIWARCAAAVATTVALVGAPEMATAAPKLHSQECHLEDGLLRCEVIVNDYDSGWGSDWPAKPHRITLSNVPEGYHIVRAGFWLEGYQPVGAHTCHSNLGRPVVDGDWSACALAYVEPRSVAFDFRFQGKERRYIPRGEMLIQRIEKLQFWQRARVVAWCEKAAS